MAWRINFAFSSYTRTGSEEPTHFFHRRLFRLLAAQLRSFLNAPSYSLIGRVDPTKMLIRHIV